MAASNGVMKPPTPHEHRLADATDNELLMLHCRGEQQALAEILHRHAAMVLCVCRRTLRHEQDAEDAFQATFLILTRKASQLTTLHSLAAWLHKVARRTAVRAARRRQQQRVEPLADMASSDQLLEEIHSREMQRVVHQELDRIPARYRDALVLAYLEGRTRRQTAEQLDCSDATVKGLLARGKRHLRLRLLRRGVALSLAAPVVLATQPAPAAMLETVAESCTAATMSQGAGAGALGAGCTENALYLAQEGIRTMTFTTLKPFLITAAAVTLLATPLLAPGRLHSADQPDESSAVLTLAATAAADDLAVAEPVVVAVAGPAEKDKPPKPKKFDTGGFGMEGAGGGLMAGPADKEKPKGKEHLNIAPVDMKGTGAELRFIDLSFDSYADFLKDRPTPEQLVQDLRLEYEELKTRRDYQKLRAEALSLAAKAKQEQAAAFKAASLKGITRESPLQTESEAVMAKAEQLLARAEMIAIERQMLQVTRRLERAVKAVNDGKRKEKEKASKAFEGLEEFGESEEFEGAGQDFRIRKDGKSSR